MDLAHPLNCVTFNVQRAARVLVRRFEQAIHESGLTAPQFATLAMLNARSEMSVSDVAAGLGADRTTLTRNLDRMAGLGWIEPAPSKDLRLHVFRLTDEGRARLARAMPGWHAFQAGLVERLGEKGAEALIGTLTTL